VFVDGKSTAEFSHDILMKMLNSSSHERGLQLTLLWKQGGQSLAPKLTESVKNSNTAHEHGGQHSRQERNSAAQTGRRKSLNRVNSQTGKSSSNVPTAMSHFNQKSTRAAAPKAASDFTKLGEKKTMEKITSQRELAESAMPIGLKYFTLKAEQDKANKLAQVKNGRDEIPTATKYFNELALEKKVEKKRKSEIKEKHMPVAVRKFTYPECTAEELKKDQKKAEIQAMRDNPPQPSPGHEHFTQQMRDEVERKKVEREERRQTPPHSPAAMKHFAKKEIERQSRSNAQKEAAALKRSSSYSSEPSVATQYFQKQKATKAEELQYQQRTMRT